MSDALDTRARKAADALVAAHREGLDLWGLGQAFMAAMAEVAPEHEVDLRVWKKSQKRRREGAK